MWGLPCSCSGLALAPHASESGLGEKRTVEIGQPQAWSEEKRCFMSGRVESLKQARAPSVCMMDKGCEKWKVCEVVISGVFGLIHYPPHFALGTEGVCPAAAIRGRGQCF